MPDSLCGKDTDAQSMSACVCQVDQQLLGQLSGMGFPHWRVVRALQATKGAGELTTLAKRYYAPVDMPSQHRPRNVPVGSELRLSCQPAVSWVCSSCLLS